MQPDRFTTCQGRYYGDPWPVSNSTKSGTFNLYEGTKVTGSPEVVLLRGNVLVEGDQLVAEPGIGQFVARAKFGEELTPERATAAA